MWVDPFITISEILLLMLSVSPGLFVAPGDWCNPFSVYARVHQSFPFNPFHDRNPGPR